MPSGIMLFFHQLFAFVFVAAVLSAHWNVLAARRTSDWARRAALLEANARTTLMFGVSALVLLGVFGNLASLAIGYRMATDSWLRWVNGLWLVLVVAALALELGAARRLAAIARAAVEGAAAAGYDAALGRWRLANAVLLVLFVAFLWLMVFRWRF